MPDPVYINDPDIGKTHSLYDLNGTLQQVKETMASNRYAQGWTATLPTVTVTGTAIASGVLESAIVTGGETLIFTLTNGGIWSSDLAALATALSTALDGSASGAGSWDDEVAAVLADTDLARSSGNTVLTLTTPAAASYAISGDETVTFKLPQNMVVINGVAWTGTTNLVCSPTTFVISNEA